jgi:3-methyladenine DNA glycosylase AlkD
MSALTDLVAKTKALYSPDRAEHSKYFFKTGPGQYGEGDVFWGLAVPEIKKIAAGFRELSLDEVKKLLAFEVHELRLIGLTILVDQYQKAKDDAIRKKIFDFYIQHRAAANNWDLVDLSCYKIMGDYLVRNPMEREILYWFIKSENMWDRRLAMVSTWAFIRQGDFKDVLQLTVLLLNDKEDLMHKAAGWMLRELGKRDEVILCTFLDIYGTTMPRTMLRYAIERFPEPQRQKYLKAKS